MFELGLGSFQVIIQWILLLLKRNLLSWLCTHSFQTICLFIYVYALCTNILGFVCLLNSVFQHFLKDFFFSHVYLGFCCCCSLLFLEWGGKTFNIYPPSPSPSISIPIPFLCRNNCYPNFSLSHISPSTYFLIPQSEFHNISTKEGGCVMSLSKQNIGLATNDGSD